MGQLGIYLNPGNENFKKTLSTGRYVDKTKMIADINRFIDTGNDYICLSRPRRFGKTIASEMLSAYYSRGCDSRELFAPYMIAGDPDFDAPDGKRNRMNVIKIDMNSEYQSIDDRSRLIKVLTEEIKRELRDEFPTVQIGEDDTLPRSLLRIYGALKETFIIIIDEYDVLVREQADEQLFAEYLSFLNGLFKSATLRPAISLAYLTGILPVIRDKIQSKLNNFREYTILDAVDLAEYVGFTADEVKELCEKNGADFAECRKWYDGYRQRGYEIYNPESVIMSIAEGRFASYWGKTSTYEAIAERIRQNFEGTHDAVVRMLAGESIDVNVTRYANSMTEFTSKNDLFTFLIHLGYLAYNEDYKTCRIPNWEVRQEWYNAIEAEPEYKETNKIIEDSKELLDRVIDGDAGAVADALNRTHIHVTSNRSYNNEDALGSAIYLAFIYALNEYTCIREVTSGRGFADVVYIPIHPGNEKRPAMVIELKRNNTAESGLNQIRKKEYFDCLNQYEGNILLIGISYDEKDKTHSCVIERAEKLS